MIQGVRLLRNRDVRLRKAEKRRSEKDKTTLCVDFR
jgi:hypothetical protein